MNHKRRIAVVTLLIVTLAGSILVRLPHLIGPIRYRHELWLTAIVLRHLEIWKAEGLAKSRFAPIMTYPGRANARINNQESLRLQIDDEGNYFYTSYPPFSLYFLYALFRLLHIQPSALWLRLLNLCWHLASAVMV